MEHKITLITQARIGSTRLPGKVLLKIQGQELLKIHLDRISKSKLVNTIVVATTENILDKQIYIKTKEWGYNSFRGNENDVLDRYYKTSKFFPSEYIVRVTSDCPLIDPILIDKIITFTIENNLDYCSNTLIENYPDGQDIEVFKSKVLEYAALNAKLKSEREHVTPYIKKHSSFNNNDKFKSLNYTCDKNYNHIRMTVDELIDFEVIKKLITHLGTDKNWEEYTKFMIENKIDLLNSQIKRNDGYIKSIKND